MSTQAVEGSKKQQETSDNIDDYLSDTDDDEDFDDFGQEVVENVAKDPPRESGTYGKLSSPLDYSGGYKSYSSKTSSSSQSARYSSEYVPSGSSEYVPRSSTHGGYEGLGHESYTGLYGMGSRSLSARVADSLSSGYFSSYRSGAYGSSGYGSGVHGSETPMAPRVGSMLYTEGLEGYGTNPSLSSRSRQVMREGYDLSLSAGVGSGSRQQGAGVAALKAVYDVRSWILFTSMWVWKGGDLNNQSHQIMTDDYHSVSLHVCLIVSKENTSIHNSALLLNSFAFLLEI